MTVVKLLSVLGGENLLLQLMSVSEVYHRSAAHHLNRRRRLCLQGRIACAVFQEADQAMKRYTRQKRKEMID